MGMVVRTNTMALNAYRQLGMNTSAVTKSLEKLSSGFRINRAGDDAAGLAISEKMKAQITGLETASANAQDGISLIQTAEGNLTEVHSMLNRMVELASKSANGTYTSTERDALQDEVDALLEEIDRISQSANFNGTRLLDGSLSNGGGGKTYAGMERIIKTVLGANEDAIANTGIKTILDNATGDTKATNTVFNVDFTGLKGGAGNVENKAAVTTTPGTAAGAAAVAAVYKSDDQTRLTADGNITIGGHTYAHTYAAADTLESQLTAFVNDYNTNATNKAWTASLSDDKKSVTFTAKVAGAFDTTNTGGTDATKAPPAALADTNKVKDGADAVAATGGTAVVDFTGKTGKDLIGSTVTIGDKTYEFIKDGGTAATGNTAVTIAEGDAAAAIATKFQTEAAKTANLPTGDDAVAADKVVANGSKVTFTLTKTGADSKFSKAESTASTNNSLDFKIGGTVLADDVVIAKDDTAATIAQKVLNKIANSDTDVAAGTKVDTKIGDINYTVELDGSKLKFTLKDDPTAENIPGNYDWDVEDIKGEILGNHTAGTIVATPGKVANSGQMANTVFRIETGDIKDGTKITVDGYTVTLAVGKDTKQDTTDAAVINLKGFEEGNVTNADMDIILSEISKGFVGKTDHFIVGTNNTGNADVQKGLTVHKREGDDMGTYDTIEKLAEVFTLKTAGAGSALTLQIGDTADDFNKMSVSVDDMSTEGLGLKGLSIATQKDASDAINRIKTAINTVSTARAGMGALQNRLEHTINNLDVAVENLSAANSRIRDTDMAKEMMNYTKMNVLVQSAQAMLAQANQQPQSVLQLLQ